MGAANRNGLPSCMREQDRTFPIDRTQGYLFDAWCETEMKSSTVLELAPGKKLTVKIIGRDSDFSGLFESQINC